MPTISQRINLIQVIFGRLSISIKQLIAPRIWKLGKNGVLKDEFICFLILKYKTPKFIIRNVNKVPIFVSSATTEISEIAENIPTINPHIIIEIKGVLNFGWIYEKNFGINLSLDIAKKILGCPAWNVSRTVVVEIKAPIAKIELAQFKFMSFNAFDKGSGILRLL